ncbi:HAD family hydrolase [Silvibacterium dinghuense]|uniref:HAD family phosphatase n=1 Tax=Silvibacterium dinghuense TaxID=1560006 RepID=A0A4Q1S9J0_9BACT|nr:HAD family phosphatase [Silvibacterium dinghuense]RXS93723.1 HAD family phosphatase [Silvibacterium dinghuense]GGH07132.1 hydrolase [Silvibacterium dinghuense]
MSEITTVLWDIGGVLLTNGWDHHSRARVLERFGVDKARFEALHPEANDVWEKGFITADEYLKRTVFTEPRNFTPEEFLAAMKAESALLENTAMPVLEDLASSGSVDLGMLNNEARELNDNRLELFGLHAYFDVFFSSCYVGLRKPDEKIYRLALDVLQVEADEVAFIDDRANNVETAKSLGIHAIRYEGPEALRASLRGLGVELNED